MATNGLLPSRPEPETTVEPELVTLDDAGVLFDALSSTMARAILTALYEDPRPVSEIAAQVDTSMQNVDYHLEKLQSAGLVEVVDTWYSEKGVEMNVYAPTSEPLVLFAGDAESERSVDAVLANDGEPSTDPPADLTDDATDDATEPSRHSPT